MDIYRPKRGIDPVYLNAVRNHDMDMIAKLAEARAVDFGAINSLGNNVLFMAEGSLPPQMIREIARLGARLDWTNAEGETALNYACRHKNFEMAKNIEIAGSEMRNLQQIENKKGFLPADYKNPVNMQMFKHIEEGGNALDVITKLQKDISNGALPDITYGDSRKSILHEMTKHNYTGNIAHLTSYLTQIVDVNFVDAAMETPIFSAVRNGNYAAVSALIEAGTYVNARNIRGQTPLHVAAESDIDNEHMYKALIYDKADVNIADTEGKTALHLAIESERSEIACLLVEAGADPNIQDNDGNTPLSVAVSKGDYRAVSILLAAGANPNLADTQGKTPIFYAVEKFIKHMPKTSYICDMLIAADADLSIRDKQGRSALSAMDDKTRTAVPARYQKMFLGEHRTLAPDAVRKHSRPPQRDIEPDNFER